MHTHAHTCTQRDAHIRVHSHKHRVANAEAVDFWLSFEKQRSPGLRFPSATLPEALWWAPVTSVTTYPKALEDNIKRITSLHCCSLFSARLKHSSRALKVN